MPRLRFAPAVLTSPAGGPARDASHRALARALDWRTGPMGIIQSLSPPIESKADLIAHLAAGSKPRSEWRIGTEHEKFGFRTSDLSPLPYDGDTGIAAVLDSLRERFGWRAVHERGNTIALTFGKQSVTLEPGGQLELSGSPLKTIHD